MILIRDPLRYNMKTVLIVEDDADMRKLIIEFIKNKYHVLEASNGQEALDKIIRHHVDITITDLMMPVLDGIEFIKKLQNVNQKPIICITGAPDAYLEKAEGVYIDRVVLKPFDPNKLIEQIEELLQLNDPMC